MYVCLLELILHVCVCVCVGGHECMFTMCVSISLYFTLSLLLSDAQTVLLSHCQTGH